MNKRHRAFKNHFYQVLEVQGTDIYDLLNRISTNLVQKEVFNTVCTMFLTEKARIVDLAMIASLSKEKLIMLVGNKEKTKMWIDKYTFSEQINFVEPSKIIVEIIDNSLKNDICSKMKRKYEVFDFYEVLSFDEKVFLVTDVKNEDNLVQKFNLFLLKDQEYHDERVENLKGEVSFEYTEDVIPLEVGLLDYISFTKGCYIGQEVIARLESQKKVSRYLVQIESKERLEDKQAYEVYNNREKKGQKNILTTRGSKKEHLALVHHSIANEKDSIFIFSEKNIVTEGTIKKVLKGKTYLS